MSDRKINRQALARLVDSDAWDLSDSDWDEEYGYDGIVRGRDERARRRSASLKVVDRLIDAGAITEPEGDLSTKQSDRVSRVATRLEYAAQELRGIVLGFGEDDEFRVFGTRTGSTDLLGFGASPCVSSAGSSSWESEPDDMSPKHGGFDEAVDVYDIDDLARDDLRALIRTHRPNFVTEGVFNIAPLLSTQYTRLRCDGDCDFRTQDASWFTVMDAHADHLTDVLIEAGYVKGADRG